MACFILKIEIIQTCFCSPESFHFMDVKCFFSWSSYFKQRAIIPEWYIVPKRIYLEKQRGKKVFKLGFWTFREGSRRLFQLSVVDALLEKPLLKILKQRFYLACPFTANQLAFHSHYQSVSRVGSNIMFKVEFILRIFIVHIYFILGIINFLGIYICAGKLTKH